VKFRYRPNFKKGRYLGGKLEVAMFYTTRITQDGFRNTPESAPKNTVAKKNIKNMQKAHDCPETIQKYSKSNFKKQQTKKWFINTPKIKKNDRIDSQQHKSDSKKNGTNTIKK